MKNSLIFAGTSEGRRLAELFDENSMHCTVSVATEYGKALVQETDYVNLLCGRMTEEEMERLMESQQFFAVIDATHPYAVEVSQNIRKACEATKTRYIRLVREQSQMQEDVICVSSVVEAADYLAETKGNIFLTTGSKELSVFTERIQDTGRLFARVLPDKDVVEQCERLGVKGKQLICMQGPFSRELNTALLKQAQAEWMVTKEGGNAGGFLEKINGAKEAGVKTILITRPAGEDGLSFEQVLKFFGIESKLSSNAEKPQIFLVGIGMGNKDTMTFAAMEAIQQADLVIGAKRMVESVPQTASKEQFLCYDASEIADYIRQHSGYRKIAILLSGDVGFYSGAKNLIEHLKEYEPVLIPGISSVACFAAKIKLPWQQMKLASMHGRKQNVIGEIRRNRYTFVLAGGKDSVCTLAKDCLAYGLGQVRLFVGTNLSYEDEKIVCDNVAAFTEFDRDGLSVLVAENPHADNFAVTHGMPDEVFERASVPMTKEEIRAVSLSKLSLTKNAVVYDIGAGTGSVSVECARLAVEGMVYAIEKKPEAVELLKKNKYKLAADNLKLVSGEAPEVLEELPAPTHAFIGGTSGKMEQIITCLLQKNPNVRIVVNAIAIETISRLSSIIEKESFGLVDIVQLSVGKAKEIGSHHMMLGLNPVWIVTLQKKKGGE